MVCFSRRMRWMVLGLAAVAFAQADEVNHWNAVACQTVRDSSASPPMVSRNLAIQSAAVYDAMNAVSGTSGGLNYSGPRRPDANSSAAVIEASYQTLRVLFSGRESQLLAERNQRLAQISDGAAKQAGIALGQATAAAALQRRAADGSGNAQFPDFGSNEIGKWRPEPPNPNGALLPGWKNVQPFALLRGDQFRVGPPPTLTSDEYAQAYNEVKSLGSLTSTTRTAEQTLIANYWADGAGTATPPGHWNRIADRVARQEGLSQLETARLFAVLNAGLADAGIAAWDVKNTYNFWRPYSGIRWGNADGNTATSPDVTWQPLLTTPNHASYVSGHSTFSSAAATILARYFGRDDISFSGTSDNGLITRQYSSFSQAAAEAGMSRIYGGIHWQFDNQAGLAMGREVGNWVFDNYGEPVPEPATLLALSAAVPLILRRRKKSQ